MSNSRPSSLIEQLRGVLPDAAVNVLRDLFSRIDSDIVPTGQLILRAPKAESRSAGSVKFLLDEGADALIYGHVKGGWKLARVIDDWASTVNANTGKTEYTVACWKCERLDGLDAVGPAFTVRLHVTGASSPDLAVDDVILYNHDINDNPVVLCSTDIVLSARPPLMVAAQPAHVTMNTDAVSNLDERRATCQSCQYNLGDKCGYQGQSIDLTTRWASRCPQGFW